MVRRHPRSGSQPWLLIAAVVLCAVPLVLHVAGYRPLSALDELQHLDYVVRVQHRDVVHRGDLVGVPAMRAQACRGVDLPGSPTTPPCDAPADAFDPEDYLGSGLNHQYQHLPLYHGVTAAGSSALDRIGVDDPVDASRLVGVAWSAAAAVVLWAGLGLLGVPPGARFGAVVLVLTAPAVLLSLSIVNNDATAPLAGALMVLVAGLARTERPGPRWLALAAGSAAVLTVALKATNGLAVVATFLALALAALAQPAGSAARHRARFAATGLLGGGVVSGAGYLLYHRLVAAPNPVPIPLFENYEADGFPTLEITRGLTEVVSPLSVGDAGLLGSGPALVGGNLVAVAVLLGVGVAAVAAHRSAWAIGLAGGAVAALALRVPLVGLANYLANDVDKVASTPIRYGQSIAPLAVAVIAVALARRAPGRGTWALVGVALLQVALVVGQLLTEL